MAKRVRKYSRITSVMVSVLAIILVIGLGFLIGYRYIFNQTERLNRYDAAVSSSLAEATATTTASGETTAVATDSEGKPLHHTDRGHNRNPSKPLFW